MNVALVLRLIAPIALATTVCAAPGATEPAQSDGPAPISITASNYKFAPTKVEGVVGEKLTLQLVSAEGVHGFGSKELGIPSTILTPGKTVEISFTPSKAGTFKTQCTIICGPEHDGMAITVAVRANER
jgi:heme/copper-type cytochrome/quinol oxidase subunit 2